MALYSSEKLLQTNGLNGKHAQQIHFKNFKNLRFISPFTSNYTSPQNELITTHYIFYAKKRDFSIEPVKILQNLNV